MIARVLGSAGFRVREEVPFGELTTFALGGPCRALVELDDPGRLGELLDLATASGSEVFVLGGGSNLLVSDQGFDGTVVRLAATERSVRLEDGRVVVTASAGEDWSSFVEWCVREGLCGLECLSGIPGTVGATPVQNVGAYGQEVASVVRAVHAWDRLGSQVVVMGPAQCRFSYRDSLFKSTGRYIVTAVEFVLTRQLRSRPVVYRELAGELGIGLGDQASVEEVARAVLRLRRRKGMVSSEEDPDSRSAGSFFTNPVLSPDELRRLVELDPSVPVFPAPGRAGAVTGSKVAAAWLVEHAGFPRGYSMVRAAISTKHALALVALEGARAADVVALARQVRDGVSRRFGVRLQPEPVLVGLAL